MNINEYKKYLQHIHNTLDDPSLNNQLRDRLNKMNEGPVNKMIEYKPDPKVDKSTDAPTTAAGDSLRPKSKTAVKEGAADASAAGGKKKKAVKAVVEEDEVEQVEEDDIDESVLAYFQNYFGDSLNEDTSDEDIMGAVECLIELCEAVTFLPDTPANRKFWGGDEKFEKLQARLLGKKKIDRKIPKVQKSSNVRKKARGATGRQLELQLQAVQYFENYLGQELNEDVPHNDIIDAANDLIYLCEVVCDAVGLKKNLTINEKLKPYWARTSSKGKPNIIHPSQSIVGGKTPYIARGLDSKTAATPIPPKYAASTTPIRTIRPSMKGSLKLTQSGKRAKDEPLVRLGQGSYEKVIRPSDLR